jgi:predicted  nucleic acid-binding Zn-ribbon protein
MPKTPTSLKKEEENIFDLTKLAPIELDCEIKKSASIVSIDDQNKILEDYTEIPKEKWDSFKYNDFLKYLRNDGTFRKGGFFKNAWVGSYGKSKDKKCMQLASSKNFKATTWTICCDDIDKIWKKNNDSTNSTESNKETVDPKIMEKINENSESIQYLTKSMEQFKIDIIRINNEQKRIINLIKKLHGIKTQA